MRAFTFAAALLVAPAAASAHFPYIHLEGAGAKRALHAYFGHGVEKTDAKYVPRLEGAKVRRLSTDGELTPVSLAQAEGSLVSEVVKEGPAVYLFEKDQGVVSRNGDYLLTNYSKSFTGPEAWGTDSSKHLRLDVTPERNGDRLTFLVRWDGNPLADTDVAVELGKETQTGKTDSDGRFTAKLARPGIYCVRAWRIEETPGDRDGKKYDDVRYYTTLTLDVD